MFCLNFLHFYIKILQKCTKIFLKRHISTSIWSGQHPHSGRNIQHSALLKLLLITQVSGLACIIECFYANLLDDLFLGFEGKLSTALMGTRQKVIGQLSLDMLNGVQMFYSATKYIFKMIFTDGTFGTIWHIMSVQTTHPSSTSTNKYTFLSWNFSIGFLSLNYHCSFLATLILAKFFFLNVSPSFCRSVVMIRLQSHIHWQYIRCLSSKLYKLRHYLL